MEHSTPSKFNWALVKRIFAMTSPYWASSGKDQKWFLLGFLSLMGSAASILLVLYSFLLEGETVSALVPSFLTHVGLIASVAVMLTAFRHPLVQRFKYVYGPVALVVLYFAYGYISSCASGFTCEGLSAWAAEPRFGFSVLGILTALGAPVGYIYGMRNRMHEGWRLLGILISLLFSSAVSMFF